MDCNKFLEGLNSEQKMAVLTARRSASRDGDSLVFADSCTHSYVRLIAGAGSGKTYTLARRVCYICDTYQIAPDRVLSLTFTKKAAGEMRDRVANMLNTEPELIHSMKTFHSLAKDIVSKSFGKYFGDGTLQLCRVGVSTLVAEYFKNHSDYFSTLSDDDRGRLQKYLLTKVKQAMTFNEYPYYLMRQYKYTAQPLSDITAVMEQMENDLEYMSKREAYKRTTKDVQADAAKREKAYAVYQKLKPVYEDGVITPVGALVREIINSKGNHLTYDDLIKSALYLLQNYSEVREYWQNQYDFIQVDEFQDTDSDQLEIVKILSERHHNLFMVGDPDQSIYLFRGAEPSLFNQLDGVFTDSDYPLHTIFMVNNYRSTQKIVDISDTVIKLNQNRIEKNGVSQVSGDSGVTLMYGADVSSQIIQEIKKIISSGVTPEEIAVLYRSKADMVVREVQLLLSKEQIDFNSTLDLHDDFYYITLELLKFLHTQDEVFLMNAGSMCSLESRCITIDKFKELAEKISDPSYLYQWLEPYFMAFKKDGEPTMAYAKFMQKEQHISDSCAEALTYWNSLSAEKKQDFCLDDLEQTTEDLSGVNIMTMHKSKGLEFGYVFVLSLTTDSMDATYDSCALCEEQARLAYVSYSRAKQKLYLCCADVQKMHGVLGQVIEQTDAPADLKKLSEKAVQGYTDRLDTKGSVTYVPLVHGYAPDQIFAYRCEIMQNGERIGYQSRIEDLERLGCVPCPLYVMVTVVSPVHTSYTDTEENPEYEGFDEKAGLLRVNHLTKDEDILAVFKGSNNGFELDRKDKAYLDSLYRQLPEKHTQFCGTEQRTEPVTEPVTEPTSEPTNSVQKTFLDAFLGALPGVSVLKVQKFKTPLSVFPELPETFEVTLKSDGIYCEGTELNLFTSCIRNHLILTYADKQIPPITKAFAEYFKLKPLTVFHLKTLVKTGVDFDDYEFFWIGQLLIRKATGTDSYINLDRFEFDGWTTAPATVYEAFLRGYIEAEMTDKQVYCCFSDKKYCISVFLNLGLKIKSYEQFSNWNAKLTQIARIPMPNKNALLRCRFVASDKNSVTVDVLDLNKRICMPLFMLAGYLTSGVTGIYFDDAEHHYMYFTNPSFLKGRAIFLDT